MNRTIPRQDHTLRRMNAGAMLAAVIALTTAYLFHIPVGGNGGYIHIGDAFVYLAGRRYRLRGNVLTEED